MAVGDQRWRSRPYRADQALGARARARSATRASLSEGDDGYDADDGEGLMGQLRGNVAIDRASGARAPVSVLGVPR